MSNNDITGVGNLSINAGSLSITADGSNAVTLTESGNGDFTIDAPDDIRLDAGGGDLVLKTSGTEYGRISSFSNNLRLTSSASDANIILQPNGIGDVILKADDGSGTTTNYLVVDGSAEQTRFYKDTRHTDNIKANFGNSDDLKIYHDGSNSFIDDTGTGDLVLNTNGASIKLLFNESEFYGAVCS